MPALRASRLERRAVTPVEQSGLRFGRNPVALEPGEERAVDWRIAPWRCGAEPRRASHRRTETAAPAAAQRPTTVLRCRRCRRSAHRDARRRGVRPRVPVRSMTGTVKTASTVRSGRQAQARQCAGMRDQCSPSRPRWSRAIARERVAADAQPARRDERLPPPQPQIETGLGAGAGVVRQRLSIDQRGTQSAARPGTPTSRHVVAERLPRRQRPARQVRQQAGLGVMPRDEQRGVNTARLTDPIHAADALLEPRRIPRQFEADDPARARCRFRPCPATSVASSTEAVPRQKPIEAAVAARWSV